jgi:hypothetical protein
MNKQIALQQTHQYKQKKNWYSFKSIKVKVQKSLKKKKKKKTLLNW